MEYYDLAWTRDGRGLTYIDANIEALVGWTADEILVQPARALVTPETYEQLENGYFTGTPDSIMVRTLPIFLRHKDGHAICCRGTAVCKYNADGNLAEAWGSIRHCQEQCALNRLLTWWSCAKPKDLVVLNRVVAAFV